MMARGDDAVGGILGAPEDVCLQCYGHRGISCWAAMIQTPTDYALRIDAPLPCLDREGAHLPDLCREARAHALGLGRSMGIEGSLSAFGRRYHASIACEASTSCGGRMCKCTDASSRGARWGATACCASYFAAQNYQVRRGAAPKK